MREKSELSVSLLDTLCCSDIIDIGSDFLEIGLDQIIDNEVLREIPIVGTFVRIGGVALSIRDRHLLKAAVEFAYDVKKEVNEEKINKHRNKLLTNPAKLQEECEYIMQYLDRQIGYEKTGLYVQVYKKYLSDDDMDWDEFKMFGEIIDGLFLSDLETLKDLNAKKKYVEGDQYNVLALKRLNSLGIIDYFSGGAVSIGGSREKVMASISTIGEVFCSVILEADSV